MNVQAYVKYSLQVSLGLWDGLVMCGGVVCVITVKCCVYKQATAEAGEWFFPPNLEVQVFLGIRPFYLRRKEDRKQEMCHRNLVFSNS